MKYLAALIMGVMISTFSYAEEDAPKTRSVYHDISPAFVSNFGFSERKLSYIKAEVSLKIENEALRERVKQNEPLIRHHIVMLLSSQTKEQMSAQAAQENIRVAALGKVNEALTEEIGEVGVQDLLFTSFVVQL